MGRSGAQRNYTHLRPIAAPRPRFDGQVSSTPFPNLFEQGVTQSQPPVDGPETQAGAKHPCVCVCCPFHDPATISLE